MGKTSAAQKAPADDDGKGWKGVSHRHPGRMLAMVMGLALLLRFVALLNLKQSIYFDFMLWDERLYHEWAKKIADGTFTSGSIYEFAPLPAYFIALVYKLFSPDIVYIRYANIVFGTATCGLVFLTGRELAGTATGLLAGLMACFYEPFIFYSIVPLKTALAVFLFACCAYFLSVLVNGKRAIYSLFLAVCLGLVDNVRPNAIVLVPLVPVLVLAARYRGKSSLPDLAAVLALFMLGIAIAQAPFMIRNYLVAGESAPTTSQGGFHFYMTHNSEYPKGIPFVTTSPTERGIQFTIEASRREGRKMTSGEASKYWRDKALDDIREHPWAQLKRTAEKTLILFNWFARGDHYDIGFISNFVRFFKFPFLKFWMIMPLAMAGLVLGIMRDRRRFLVPGIACMAYAGTLILFFTNIRMRLPALVFLIPFAAAGLINVRELMRVRENRKVMIYGAVAIAFLVITWIPVGSSRRGGLKSSEDLTAFYNTHAIILDSRGDEDGAMAWWLESSRLKGRFSAFANLSLAGKYMKKGRPDVALSFVAKIPDDSFAVALKYEMIGDIMFAQRKVRKAVDAYEKGIAINSGLRRIRFKLAKIFERIDPRRANLEYAKLAYINSFYDLYLSKKPGEGNSAHDLRPR